MRKDVECPYCGEDLEINHDGDREEDELYEQECRECLATFVYKVVITEYYDARKADCLNGAPHKFKKTRTYPPEFARMRCIDCGYETDLTP